MSPWLRLAQLVAPYRWRIGLAFSLAGAACLLGLAAPLLIERLLITAGAGRGWSPLAVPAAGLLLAVALQNIASSSNAWLFGGVALDLVRELRRKLYTRMQQMPLAWFDRTPTGAIMSRLMDDVSVVQSLAGGQTLVILIDLCTAGAAAAWVVSRSWGLALVLVGMMPVYIIIFRLFTRPIRARTLDVRYQLDQVFAHLKQKIDGIQVVRATAREAGEIAAFTEKITALHRPRVHVNHLGIAFSNLCVGVGGIGSAVVFAVGAYEVAGGSLTTGELIAISALAGLIFTPITRLSELAASYQQAATSLTRLGEILDFPLIDRPQFESIDEKTVPAGVCGRIEFDRVSFHYLPDRPVLHDISLCIESGRKVAIVGPTGSGKTTLMNLLLRFYEPTSGEVRIDDRPLGAYSVRDLRRHLGVVPQEPVIFRGTLAENICYGTPGATPSGIKASARAALVHDLADSLPQQYGTLVGEGGHPLSQGERQRIAIARLFCKSPSIVVLDEATSALDRASETLVQDALDRLLSGRTTFVIAHRLATILTADQIIVMDQGRIVQMGTHAGLLADENGLYRKLYECQFGAAGEPQRPGPLDPNPRDAAEQPVVLEPVCA